MACCTPNLSVTEFGSASFKSVKQSFLVTHTVYETIENTISFFQVEKRDEVFQGSQIA